MKLLPNKPRPLATPHKAEVFVNHTADGLGDALLGLCAVGGLHVDTNKRIEYKVNAGTIPFVKLFNGGYYSVSVHGGEGLPINNGYHEEIKSKAVRPRWQRYCDNIGASKPVLPTLRQRDKLLDMGKGYAGVVCLAPFSAWRCREWPLHAWLTLLKLLQDDGYRVVVLDNVPGRAERFGCEKVINQSAEIVASIILNASVLISGDSGLAHLSGLLGQTILLSGPTDGKQIFGLYPRMTFLYGSLACSGCWWQPTTGDGLPAYSTQHCEPRCASLGSIQPQEVLSAVQRLTPGRSLLSQTKLDWIARLVKETASLPGELAELGVYRGGSAKVIAQACPHKTLHLYDTFHGLPHDDIPEGHHKKGDFTASLEGVKSYLSGLNVEYHVGFFPETTAGLEDKAYSFVHMDADLYTSSVSGLQYFYSRLVPGGILALDDVDWKHTPGVSLALREAGLYEQIIWDGDFAHLRKP